MKKFLKSLWVVILAPLLVTIIGGLIQTKLENVDFFAGIGLFFKKLISLIIKVLNFNIPIWTIVIAIIIIIVIIYLFTRLNNSTETIDVKWYKSYNEEEYKNVLYTWNYAIYFNEFSVEHLRPICKKCKGELTDAPVQNGHYYMSKQLYCPNCDEEVVTPTEEDIRLANVYIHNNLKRKQKEVVEKMKNDK